MRLYMAIIVGCLFPTVCLAGAWTAERGTLKLSLSQISQRNDIIPFNDIAYNDKLREDFTGLLVEYGLTDKLTLTGELGESRFRITPHYTQTQNAQLGFMLDAPYLASGLLPPFLFGFTKTFLPSLKLHREKRTSVHYGRFYTDGMRYEQEARSGRYSVLSLADKLMSGRFHLMQEAEISQRRGAGIFENNGLYRFSLGYEAWQISTQSTRYENEMSGYTTLSHSYRLRWKPVHGNFEIALGRGHKRIGQAYFPDARVFRGRLWSIEIQRRF